MTKKHVMLIKELNGRNKGIEMPLVSGLSPNLFSVDVIKSTAAKTLSFPEFYRVSYTVTAHFSELF